MAGTTPLKSHVPANEPISKRIIIDGIAELMLLTICLRILNHLCPNETAIIAAIVAASSKAIWLAPERVSLPKKYTFKTRKIIRNRMGINA